MRHSLFALRALATLTLSTASALPQYAEQGILAEQTFSCTGKQTLSLCCSGRIPLNGAVEDCQESVHFLIGPTRLSASDYSRQLHSSTVHQCSSEQLQKGFNRPICCKSGFKPAVGAPGYNGLNCVSGQVDGGSKWSFKPKSASFDTSKYSELSKRTLRQTIPKTSPLAAAVETIPVADDEARIFALSPEPKFPEELEGSPNSPSLSKDPAKLSALLSEIGVPVSRRALRKRSRETTLTDAEPFGNGHQTQDAVLKDLLTSTSLTQRDSRARVLGRAGSVTTRSTALGRRNPRDVMASQSFHAS